MSSPESKYLVGWSCGKETLRSGHFDTLKGSFYVNCAFDVDPMSLAALQKQYPDFPQYTATNIWPPVGRLPSFSQSLKDLCNSIIDTAGLVARACDRYAEANIDGYEPGYLERTVKMTRTTKARLLHYFPAKEYGNGDNAANGNDDEDDWCATHIDHSCLTGLTSAMFVDESAADLTPTKIGDSPQKPLPELLTSPDPEAGLYIRSRTGETVKVNIPKDCLAFQTGEALELITRGKFRAVPHFVRGAKVAGPAKIARNTLAVFTQPDLGAKVEPNKTFAEFAREVVERNH